MYTAVISLFDKADIAVMSAAVADYTPAEVANEKIKKKDDTFSLTLTRTKDILQSLGKAKKNGQLVVGFALETTNGHQFATDKLKAKNADMIVLNSLNDPGAGFGHDTNKITVFNKSGSVTEFPIKSKKDVAEDIVDLIIKDLR
jgi:phosphopantothenoylcysteine decarboxylase/phosphopantothenate--cysteine ligase